MAEIKIPNLCGSSPEFNSIQDKFEKLIDEAIDNLEAEASAAASAASSAFTDLESELRALVSLAPTLPEINLQSLLTSLSSMTPGTFEHITLLKDIKDDFETELAAAGYDIDTLVTNALTQIQSGGDLCTVVPNFTKPADASEDAKEVAVESKQPTVDSEKEEPPTFLRNAILFVQQEDAKLKVASMQTEGDSEDEDVVTGTITSTTPPTEDKGAYTVTKEEKPIIYKTTKTGTTKTENVKEEAKEPKSQKVTTPKDQKGKNVAATSLTKRPNEITEIFTIDDVTQPPPNEPANFKFTLKHIPYKIQKVRGNTLIMRWWPPRRPRSAQKRELFQLFWSIHDHDWEVPLRRSQAAGYGDVVLKAGRYELDGKTIKIFSRGNNYTEHKQENNAKFYRFEKEGQIFKVTYSYFENYDPSIKPEPKK